MTAGERECLLALSHVRGLLAGDRRRIAATAGSAAGLRGLAVADLEAIVGRQLLIGEWDAEDLEARAERTARILAARGFGCLFHGDPGYPLDLANIFDPPATLFHRGPVPGPDRTLVAIVGTRLPTGAGREGAFRLALELAREGVSVVSGLARGVDREAHEGCLRGGAPSIGVLASGVDLVSPGSSRAVARRMLDAGGAILSEYPPGTMPRAYRFPERNRLISGLARSVVIVQAPERSGALITADYALEQGRDLYVHAAGLAGNASAGTRRLVDDGAPVVRSAAGILADWARCGRPRGSLAESAPRVPGDAVARGSAAVREACGARRD